MNKFKLLSFFIASFFLGLISIYYYHFFSPKEENLYSCTIKKITGYDCPGCGGQRAFHYFLHGDFGNSFKMNPIFLLVFIVVFYYLYVIIYYFLTKKNIDGFLNSKKFIFTFLLFILIFGVLRNIF